ncbi:MAG: peptidoglycan editing factor PgeF [Synechococcus sp.]
MGCYGGYYLQCDRLEGFEHGFFTRQWAGRGPEVLAGYLSAGVSVHRPQQVHGARVVAAGEAVAEPWPEADGLVSSGGGQSLWVCGADCTPVLLADPRSGRTAACHAGWRGVAGGIVPAAIAALEAAGSRRQDLQVALGPAISGARYQVEDAVVEAIAAGLGTTSEELRRSGALQEDPEPGRHRLDIRAATVVQLRRAGLDPAQIAECPLCTAAEPELFHSWRRDQVKAVQWSGIVAQA